MPELPEVETIRLSLIPALVGHTIKSVTLGPFPGVIGPMAFEMFEAGLVGRTFVALWRRGKYLMMDLDNGSGIEVHLRMTGNLTVTKTGDDPVRFEYLSIDLDGEVSLRYSDQRKFGRVLFHPYLERQHLDRRLGPEPLEPGFSSAYLADKLQKRTAPIKSLILDQRIIAGVGNIYADEALFRSRLHPLRPGGSLSEHEVASLVRSIKHVLRQGVENRGTSFSSYRDGYGETGANQFRLRVYGRGRSGDPCPRCGRELTVVHAGGRTSHVCAQCQPLVDARSGTLS